MGPGPITVARLAALYPYDNTLRAVKISGAQLRAYLEQSARYFRTHPDGRVDVDRSFDLAHVRNPPLVAVDRMQAGIAASAA